jgi:glucokinase
VSRRPARSRAPALLGDIGGTNARFALLDSRGRIEQIQVLACDDHAGLAEAVESYLAGLSARARASPRAAAIDVAGPVAGDFTALTNHPWSFSQRALKSRLGLEQLLVVNDFAAVAAATPHLGRRQRLRIGGKSAAAEAPIGVIGPGSGLGVGAILPIEGRWIALAGEGGHVSLAPGSLREDRVLDLMRRRFGHVSAERALSGPGLVNLYNVLSELDGMPAQPYGAEQVTDPALCESDSHCREALMMFADMLGTVAGDLALTLGARGGVYIAGGIVPRLGRAFPSERFRQRFEDKGRMRRYLAEIPTFLIRHPYPAFLGLAALLQGRSAIAG